MKKIGTAILMAVGFCCAQDQDSFQPAATNVWGAAYPRIDASRRAQ